MDFVEFYFVENVIGNKINYIFYQCDLSSKTQMHFQRMEMRYSYVGRYK